MTRVRGSKLCCDHQLRFFTPNIALPSKNAIHDYDSARNISQSIAHAADAGRTEADKKAGKKLMVELLTVRDAKAQASAAFMQGKAVALALPDITLRDIGRAKGDVTPGELGQEIAAAMKAKLSAAASFDRLMQSTGDALNQAGSAVKGLFK
jgi:hypothetical protein